MRKPITSDGFWSSSPCDLDNSTIQSQRSISSVSTLNQILYQSNGTSTAGTDPEFVNQGLFHWNQSRHQWVGRSLSEKQNQENISISCGGRDKQISGRAHTGKEENSFATATKDQSSETLFQALDSEKDIQQRNFVQQLMDSLPDPSGEIN